MKNIGNISPAGVENQESSEIRSVDKKLFVIALRAGRLANRLILFANFIALAEEKRHRVINVTFHSYARWFDATRRDIYCQYPVAASRSWMDIVPGVANLIRASRILYRGVRAACVLNDCFPISGGSVVRLRTLSQAQVTLLEDPAVEKQIGNARIVFVYDWRFRAPQWVRRHANRIRAYFQPLESIDRECWLTVDRLRQQADLIVGVHIRQGDYRGWRQGKFFFPVFRYTDWMRELAGQFPGRKVAFFVCSDEPRAAREFPGLAVKLGTSSPVQDLYTLARCDFLMGPPSTFSQWASFYGNVPLLHLYESGVRIKPCEFATADLGNIPG